MPCYELVASPDNLGSSDDSDESESITVSTTISACPSSEKDFDSESDSDWRSVESGNGPGWFDILVDEFIQGIQMDFETDFDSPLPTASASGNMD